MFRKIWNFFFGKRVVTIVYVGDLKSGYCPTEEEISKVKQTLIDGGVKNVVALQSGVTIETFEL